MQDKEEAVLQWNVVEFLKDIVRLGNNPSIYHSTVPGQMATINEAVKQHLVVITNEKETFNSYMVTFEGLLLSWEHDNSDDPRLISRKVK